MAIEDLNQQAASNNNTSFTQQAPQGNNMNQQAQQPRPAPSFGFTPTMGGGLFGAPMPATMGSKGYQEMKKKLGEVYATINNPNIKISILDLDKSTNPELAFSAMIVTALDTNNQAGGVAYHILMLEATGARLEPIVDNDRGQQIEILRPTEVAIDNELMRLASELVSNTYPRMPIRYTDATVVPENFKADDEKSLYELALNAGLAVSQELRVSDTSFHDVNLVEFVAPDSRLHIAVKFTPSQIQDMVGSPMRSDVTVNFTSSRQKEAKFASVNSGNRDLTLNEVSGFVDLVPTMAPQMPGGYGYGMPPMGATQRYTARLVLTNLSSNFAYTPGGMLLAILTAMQVGENNNWTQAFRPLATRPGELDMRDIGALNIEANIMNEAGEYGTPVDTKAEDFDLRALGQLVGNLVRPGMMVSLDCPIAGPQTWYTSIFRGASNNIPEARAVMLNAANQLTNGNFEKIFPHNSPVFVDQGNRVHLGHWTDVKGIKRDIRDFDLLAVCNLQGRQNPRQIREWAKTFVDTTMTMEARLQKRKQMIMAMSGETAVFTGFAERVTFSGAFLDAFSKACFATNMPVSVTTPLSSADLNYQRPVADFAAAAVMSPQSVFVPGGMGVVQGNRGYAYGGNYRWNA